MGDKKYCICCGEEVPYYIVERDQKREYACTYCGFTLEVLKLWEETEVPGQTTEATEQIKEKIEERLEFEKRIDETEWVKGEEKQDSGIKADIKGEKAELEGVEKEKAKDDREDKTGEKIETRIEAKGITENEGSATKVEKEGPPKNHEIFQSGIDKTVQEATRIKVEEKGSGLKEIKKGWADLKTTHSIVAEDSEFLRTLLKELILRKSLSDHVIVVTNGLELVAEYTRLMNQGASVNFVIADINMPVMDGLTAIRTIRALEDNHSIERVPVVFFSAVKATEDLRKQMGILEPANYINKGVSPAPQILAERVEVLLHFLTYRYAKRGRQEQKLRNIGP